MQFIHRNDPNAVGPGIDPAAEPAYRRADASTELPAMTEPAVVAPTKPERVDLLPLIAANVAPIAGMLFLSEASVEKHITAIFQKLGLEPEDGNRRVLAALAHIENHGSADAGRNDQGGLR